MNVNRNSDQTLDISPRCTLQHGLLIRIPNAISTKVSNFLVLVQTWAFTHDFSISFICVSFLATQIRLDDGERMNAFEVGTTVTSSCMDTGIATGSEYHVMILSGKIKMIISSLMTIDLVLD